MHYNCWGQEDGGEELHTEMNGGVLWGRPRPGRGCSAIDGWMVIKVTIGTLANLATRKSMVALVTKETIVTSAIVTAPSSLPLHPDRVLASLLILRYCPLTGYNPGWLPALYLDRTTCQDIST